MFEEDKIRLKANHKYLVQNLVVEEISDHLYQTGVLSDDELEDLDAERTATRKARRLLRILPKKNNPAYKHFLDSLNEGNFEHIVVELNQTNVDTYKESDYVDALHEEDKIKQLQSKMFLQTELLMAAKKELDFLKGRVEKNEEESSQLKARYCDLEQTMSANGLKEGHVIEILKDYLSSTDVPDMHSSLTSPLPSPKYPIVQQAGTPGSRVFTFDDIELQTDSKKSCVNVAREMGRDIVKYVVQKALNKNITEPKNKYCATMRRLVDELYAKWQDLFDRFINRLNMDQISGYETFISVADEIFKEGENNWGRVVVLYGFAGYVARHCVENDMEKITQFMGDFLGYYVVKKLGPWINENGGWEAFLEKFNPAESDPSGSMWKSLLWTAVGIAGVGTLVGIVATRNS